MATNLSRDLNRESDDITMIGDDWRVRTRLMLSGPHGSSMPTELGFGDLAEMVAKARRLSKTTVGTLYLKIETDGWIVDADEIDRLANDRNFPVLI